MEKPALAQVEAWLKSPKGAFYGGNWDHRARARSLGPINPAKSATLCVVPVSDEEQVNAAVKAASECFEKGTWKRLAKREQARLMRQIGEVTRKFQVELATIEALNNGKLYKEALLDDLPDCADIFDYYAGWTDKIYGETCPVDYGFLNYTIREPLGVCAQIVPWNFPLLMAMWKIAPAIATGNCVVIKPSEHTPLSLIRWFELIHQHIDLPKGLLNLVLGDGETGALLSRHPNIHKIAFTGSTNVGKSIVQSSGASNLKAISLELGGKSPNIFFDDTPDLEVAIKRSFYAIFCHKGEKCSEPTRFIVHESIHDAVVQGLAALTANYKVGDNFIDSNDQGAQNNQSHFNKILSYIEFGKSEGATLVAGGNALKNGGLFVEPTIFSGVKSHMRIWREEIFGPVLSIAKFSSDAEAVKLANETNYGLAAGLWTKNFSRAHAVAAELNAGMIFINKYGCYDFSSPFGGFKESGWGKEMGKHSIDIYTKTKSIWVAL